MALNESIMKELEQIDEELKPLRDEKGKLAKDKIFSWLQMKGAIRFVDNKGTLTPVVLMKFEGGKLLYESLVEKFDLYTYWKSKGKKLVDIGDLGLQNEQTEQERADKVASQVGADISGDFEDDIPFGRKD